MEISTLLSMKIRFSVTYKDYLFQRFGLKRKYVFCSFVKTRNIYFSGIISSISVKIEKTVIVILLVIRRLLYKFFPINKHKNTF